MINKKFLFVISLVFCGFGTIGFPSFVYPEAMSQDKEIRLQEIKAEKQKILEEYNQKKEELQRAYRGEYEKYNYNDSPESQQSLAKLIEDTK